MEHASTMDLVVILEKDPDSDEIIAKVPQLPGCHTQGRTKAEAMRNIRDAIKLYVDGEDVAPGEVVGIERIPYPE